MGAGVVLTLKLIIMRTLNLTTGQVRRLVITAIVLLFCAIASVSGQDKAEYRIEGDSIVKINSKSNTKKSPEVTGLTHTIKGVKYPVYKGARGGYFIIRKSKKTGKEYRQYLKVK